MSYETAPATILLATHCACCARPLVDSKSVELGMGPVCRKRHGFNLAVADEVRVAANKLVYAIALENSSGKPNAGLILDYALVLRGMGFEKLSGILIKRTAAVKIEAEGDMLAVHTPYSPEAVAAFRTIPGRRWDKDRKLNLVPVGCRRELFNLLTQCFPKRSGIGPKGAFVLA
jgi:hypothetical protein